MSAIDYRKKFQLLRDKIKRGTQEIDKLEWRMYSVAHTQDISALWQELKQLRTECVNLEKELTALEREWMTNEHA